MEGDSEDGMEVQSELNRSNYDTILTKLWRQLNFGDDASGSKSEITGGPLPSNILTCSIVMP